MATTAGVGTGEGQELHLGLLSRFRVLVLTPSITTFSDTLAEKLVRKCSSQGSKWCLLGMQVLQATVNPVCHRVELVPLMLVITKIVKKYSY